jgi:hypothetical protein
MSQRLDEPWGAHDRVTDVRAAAGRALPRAGGTTRGADTPALSVTSVADVTPSHVPKTPG